MLSQHLNTLTTLSLTKWVDTGDKIIDTTIVGIFALLISGIICHFTSSWDTYYNIFIFYCYRMYRDPVKILGIPYRINIKKYSSYNDFRKENEVMRVYPDNHNKNLYDKYMKTYINSMQLQYLISEDGIGITFGYSLNSYIYPIGITKDGTIVYLDYGTNIFFSKNRYSIDYISKYLYDHLLEMEKLDKNKCSTDDIYVPEVDNTQANKTIINLKSIGKISKKKTFDTLFYPQKNDLINIIKRFQEGKMYPEHIPMDNKLGILLYGPPGTGKTGTISAIANMLGRSLLVINFAEITTCKELDKIMIPDNYPKYVYVFDEFDCILDAISNNDIKDNKDNKVISQDWGTMLLYAEGEERKNIIQMMKDGKRRKDDSPIDMAYLLQKLDGLEDSNNRIIIATTNNPDKINKALLRPGRFDIKICLGLCTQEMIIDIISNFYKGDNKLRDRIAKYNIPGDTYSPLELINKAIQFPDINDFLNFITEKNK